MKPWREIAVPHPDVLTGTFQQSEFAADISAVRTGKAPPVYQDARTFFARTFITEGMRMLLTQVAERLNGRGGEPVMQLQTSFGGGKTHTMLAVYHLATRTCPLNDLPGIPSLLEQAGWKKGGDGIREKGGKKLKLVFQTSVNSLRQKEQADGGGHPGERRHPRGRGREGGDAAGVIGVAASRYCGCGFAYVSSTCR